MEPFCGDGGPGMFAMPEAKRSRLSLKEAGFESVRTETMEIAWGYETGDESGRSSPGSRGR